MEITPSNNIILDPLRLIYYLNDDGKNIFMQSSFNAKLDSSEVKRYGHYIEQYEKPIMDIASVDILNQFYSVFNKSEWIALCNQLNQNNQYFYTLKRIVLCGINVYYQILTEKEKKQLGKIFVTRKRPINLDASEDEIIKAAKALVL